MAWGGDGGGGGGSKAERRSRACPLRGLGAVQKRAARSACPRGGGARGAGAAASGREGGGLASQRVAEGRGDHAQVPELLLRDKIGRAQLRDVRVMYAMRLATCFSFAVILHAVQFLLNYSPRKEKKTGRPPGACTSMDRAIREGTTKKELGPHTRTMRSSTPGDRPKQKNSSAQSEQKKGRSGRRVRGVV